MKVLNIFIFEKVMAFKTFIYLIDALDLGTRDVACFEILRLKRWLYHMRALMPILCILLVADHGRLAHQIIADARHRCR